MWLVIRNNGTLRIAGLCLSNIAMYDIRPRFDERIRLAGQTTKKTTENVALSNCEGSR